MSRNELVVIPELEGEPLLDVLRSTLSEPVLGKSIYEDTLTNNDILDIPEHIFSYEALSAKRVAGYPVPDKLPLYVAMPVENFELRALKSLIYRGTWQPFVGLGYFGGEGGIPAWGQPLLGDKKILPLSTGGSNSVSIVKGGNKINWDTVAEQILTQSKFIANVMIVLGLMYLAISVLYLDISHIAAAVVLTIAAVLLFALSPVLRRIVDNDHFI